MSIDRNKKTINIDKASSLEIVEMMNEEDKKIAFEVEKSKNIIAKAINEVTDIIKNGGRMVYIGSGTSGKLAVIDASECPPTFGINDNTIIALISGGREAISYWKEETEDNRELAINDLREIGFSNRDVLIAVSASGNTPYAIEGIKFANQIGAKTLSIFCNKNGKMKEISNIPILIDVGPEVIAGSTRLKAGTAQKMVLNMLSTGVMIKLGYVYSNLMINVKPINKKLKERVVDMVNIVTNEDKNKIKKILERNGYNAKDVIKALKKGE
ncbi:N-acetylmuramic acid 6-phosphate etherase [Hypnocyclicus thermotrophus]|uniref:N-acetylmuramic acid 6-phosphate etherase n=1 Tax=Hypnocyclicus thermotrophus TaxID=1627895 RepID=A0AA46DYT8_9FUSO|nr:N-acetylmuramic acid 6-phosphate etherase [Hypnocyclicus thermotrophus]TDT70557.1 N-acetylmuramic acid 6-phosphate etherase [Hypnocyclicus thermotrophus]